MIIAATINNDKIYKFDPIVFEKAARLYKRANSDTWRSPVYGFGSSPLGTGRGERPPAVAVTS